MFSEPPLLTVNLLLRNSNTGDRRVLCWGRGLPGGNPVFYFVLATDPSVDPVLRHESGHEEMEFPAGAATALS